MKTEFLFINRNQYLSEVIDTLQTNAIYFKYLTNIGATTLEINAPRNSIIIEANVPVIVGKKKKGILAIYEKVGIEDVVNYLVSAKKYKKIIVTPESFYKVMAACKLLNIHLFEDYFLLFDECDRIIKDVAFRPNILLPMDVFFKFKNKALISATAILPSDPRFDEHGFHCVQIRPNFIEQKPITLVPTNNIHQAFKDTLDAIESNNICVFINSTNLIASIINTLGIKDSSVVYCSRESSQQLYVNGFKSFDNLNGFKKYNFFTSRFYSAVDILMESKPTVIMITDTLTATHTMIDPYTDATQIIGRFRNGVEDVFHISNFDEDLISMSEDEIMAYLKGCEGSYSDIKSLRDVATNIGAVDTLNEALRLVPYNKFLTNDGSKNHFMIDNMITEERIKSYYSHPDMLEFGYVCYDYVPEIRHKFYALNETDLLKIKNGINTLEVVKAVVEALKVILNQEEGLYSINNKQQVLEELNKSHGLIVEGFKVLGESELLKNGYSKRQLKQAINQKKKVNDCSNFQFLDYLTDNIIVGAEYTERELSKIFSDGIKKHSLSITSKPSIIKEIFNLSPRTTVNRNGDKGYKILGSKFQRTLQD